MKLKAGVISSVIVALSLTTVYSQEAGDRRTPSRSADASGDAATEEEYRREQQRQFIALEAEIADLERALGEAKSRGDTEQVKRLREDLETARRLLANTEAPARPAARPTGRDASRAADVAIGKTGTVQERIEKLVKAIEEARAAGDQARASRLRSEVERLFQGTADSAREEGEAPRSAPDDKGSKAGTKATARIWSYLDRLEKAVLRMKGDRAVSPEVIATEKELVDVLGRLRAAAERGDDEEADRLRYKARSLFEDIVSARGGAIASPLRDADTEARLVELVRRIQTAREAGDDVRANELREKAKRLFDSWMASRAMAGRGIGTTPGYRPVSIEDAELQEIWQHIGRLERSLLRLEEEREGQSHDAAVKKRLARLVKDIQEARKKGDEERVARLRERARGLFETLADIDEGPEGPVAARIESRLLGLVEAIRAAKEAGDDERAGRLRNEARGLFEVLTGTGARPHGRTAARSEKRLVELVGKIQAAKQAGDEERAAKLRRKARGLFEKLSGRDGGVSKTREQRVKKRLVELVRKLEAAKNRGDEATAGALRLEARRLLESLTSAEPRAMPPRDAGPAAVKARGMPAGEKSSLASEIRALREEMREMRSLLEKLLEEREQ